jgi:uncharacterized protein with PQ loop repeat
MMKTYKTKSTRDFSATFLFLRIIGNSIWIGYSIEIDSLMMFINNMVTVFASLFIGYYKVIELYSDYKQKKLCSDEIPLNNSEDDNDEKIIITD